MSPQCQYRLRWSAFLAENKAHRRGLLTLRAQSHQPAAGTLGQVRDHSADPGGRQVAGVQDKRNHAEVSVGQAVLQKPRECLSFLFPCVFALSLLDPFLGIPGFISPVTCRRSLLSFLRITTAPNNVKERPPRMESQGYRKRCPKSD